MLRLNNLRKAFGPVVAVDGLSLEVERGEVLGLLGPNGAGKSTTISMAVGLLKPDSGTVTLEGVGNADSLEARRLLGLAPQALAVYDELTGLENVVFFARLYGLSASAARDAAKRALDMVGLGAKLGHRAKTYSGGMKRRLNLAVALVHRPPMLLLDEPTAGVDPQSRANILDLVRSLKEAGTTIVYTTHYMEEAQRLCDRVAIIDQGKLLALATVDELIASHGGASVIHVTRPEGHERISSNDPIRELGPLLARGDVLAVRIDRPDLEGVFLSLTGRSLRD
ncbi:MAG: ABC transporter ATP-binding protein [Planctomycetota bacterium]|nr:ABC transporter ATP-binding protein [Planctomycetota bacterium]